MKKLLLSLALLLVGIFANAQVVADWSSTIPTLSNYNNHTIASDSQGNVYSVGVYNGTANDFDPGSGVFNMDSFSNNMYILKLDAAGNFVWAKQIGGGTNYAITSATSITIDSSDNIYISGSTNKIVGIGNLDFDPGAGLVNVINPTGHYVMYILKLDSNGNYIWDKQFNNPANTSYDLDTIQSMKVDASGNVYATGGYNGTVDFDPSAGVYNLTSVATYLSTEIFILKLDNLGNFVWAKALQNNDTTTGSKIDKGYAIDVDTSENVYTVGYFWGAIDADPGAATHSLAGYTSNNPIIVAANVLYVSKLDASGNFVWAYNLVGDHNLQFLPSMAVDNSNNIIISGSVWSNVSSLLDFDFGAGTYNLPTNIGAYVFKINANAGFIWAKGTVIDNSQTINDSQDYSTGLTLDAVGNIYTTGGFRTTRDFDSSATNYNLTSAGNYDTYVSKLDTNGNFIWATKAGGTGLEWGYSLAVSPQGKVIVSGSTDTGFDRSVAVTTGGFLASFTQPALATSKFDLDKNILIYPNPTSGNFNIEVNQDLIGAKVTVYNVLGQKIKDFALTVLITHQNLEKGMYLLEIEKEGSVLTKKIIVN